MPDRFFNVAGPFTAAEIARRTGAKLAQLAQNRESDLDISRP
jgi:hypothetical protein